MRSFVQCVASPSVDTPGTLLLLHFDSKRYLIGNLSEGTSRASVQHGLALRKVDDVFITGRTRWSNIGGLLGFILNLADVKKSAAESISQAQSQSANAPSRPSNKSAKTDRALLNLYGAKNLNYAIATARRFIFRTGLPVTATEHPLVNSPAPEQASKIEPSWSDDNILVWSMAIRPSDGPDATPSQNVGGRKRSFDQMLDANAEARASFEEAQPTKIVQQMFDSDWKMDRLIEQPLRDVQLPATLFARDATTGKLEQYAGPMPGSGAEVPDINVMVRRPWPGATTEKIPPTLPSEDSICYIVRNHPQRGKFLPKLAKELKVEPASLYSELANGKTVKNTDGQDVTPQQVMEPGKQGGGFAVADIPSVAYISSLESRPEFNDPSVMDGIGAFIWILGRGVVQDRRIQAFMDRLKHLKHIVSSPDLATNEFALRAAARSAWINHTVHPDSFPILVDDPQHLSEDSAIGPGKKERYTTARPGLTVNLEPAVELEEGKCEGPIGKDEVVANVTAELDEIRREIGPLPSGDGVHDQDWPREAEYKDVEVLSLGTGSSHPALVRNVSSTLLRVPGCGSYVLDAGEGTLGTLRRMYSKAELDDVLRDIRMIWISHMHADHHLGLTSLIKAWYEAAHGSRPGPEITSSSLDSADGPLLGIVSDSPMLHWLYEYSAVEDFGYSRILPLATRPTTNARDPAQRSATQLYLAREEPSADAEADATTARYLARLNLAALSTVKVSHCRGAQAITLQTTTGFRASYSGDCRPSADLAAIGADSHLLIHEATFEDEMRDEALAKRHSTAGEALVVARAMRAQAVLLTHFSQRYPKMPPLGAGAEAVHGALGAMLEARPASAAGADDDDVPAVATDEAGPNAAGRRSAGAGSAAQPAAAGGQRVVMAFDYMRLRLGDLAALEAKQPVLRFVYDGLEEVKERKEAARREAARQQTERQEAERRALLERKELARKEAATAAAAKNGDAGSRKERKRAQAEQQRAKHKKHKSADGAATAAAEGSASGMPERLAGASGAAAADARNGSSSTTAGAEVERSEVRERAAAEGAAASEAHERAAGTQSGS